jgi:HK97 family phage portal protein
MWNLVSRALTRGSSTKRVTSDDRWLGATVTRADEASSRFRHDRGVQEAVSRARQWVEVCARRNASACAAQPLRLYVPAKGGGAKRSWAKAVTGRKRNDYLRHPTRGPGHKAAMYAEVAGDVEEVIDHPVLHLLRTPNPWQRYAEWMHLAYYALELAGNRYWHVVMRPGKGGPSGLYTMAPQHTRPIVTADEFLAGWVYGRDGVSEAEFRPDEVLHAKHMPSLFSPYVGVGPLWAMFAEADLDAAAKASELARWRNDARPDWVLKLPPETATSAVEAIKSQINSEFRGINNRGRFLVATVADIKPLQFTAKEMEYIAGTENVERRIWAAFGVPESEVKLNDANLASSRTGSVQYLRNTIKPRICAQAEDMTETLLPLYGIEPGEMWFAYDDPVPQDEQQTAQVMVSLVGARILTRNEARAEMGYGPLDGLDEFEEPVDPFGDGGGGDTDDEAEPDKAAYAEDDPAPERRSDDDEKAAPAVGRAVVGHRVKDDRGIQFTAEQERRIARLEKAVRAWFNRLAATVTPAPDGSVDLSDRAAEFAEIVAPYIHDLFEDGAAAGLAKIGLATDDPLSVVPERAIDFLRGYNLRLAGRVTQTTVDEIKAAIGESLAEGETIVQRTDRVRTLLGDSASTRAERIARTESVRAYSHGNIEAWKGAGVKRKRWVLSTNPCELCQAMAAKFNQPVPVGEPFLRRGESIGLPDGSRVTIDYDDLDGPPAHPNCNCDLDAVLED